MKVLFVSSGNNKNGISPIVFNQGESIKQQGIDIDYFTIKGKGLLGYIQNIPKIRVKLKRGNYDLVHAHYSLAALAVTLSCPKVPLVVSFMGSDSKTNLFYRLLIKTCYILIWSKVIVKAEEMKDNIKLKQAAVIPNGVEIKKFKKKDKKSIKKSLALSENKSYLLFLSNPDRYEKNYSLALKAYHLLNDNAIELLPVYDKPHSEVINYFHASDLLLLTSLWEGSPNAVKEAMACNLPVVSTDVGNVKWLFGNDAGHFITSLDPKDVAEKIKAALDYSKKFGRTNGRKRIIELGLDSETIAKKIINVYKEVLNKTV